MEICLGTTRFVVKRPQVAERAASEVILADEAREAAERHAQSKVVEAEHTAAALAEARAGGAS